MILGSLNGKGGSGKTTLALGVAGHLAASGARVLVLDADPQGTASDWHASRDEGSPSPFPVARIDRPVIHREISRLSRGYDHVVVDGAPRNADLQRSAILACTHIMIPAQPSGADLWASREFLSLLADAKEFAPAGQVAALVISRRIPGTVLGRDFRSSLDGYGLPVLDGTTQRIAYAEALGAGQTVQEYDPKGEAARELAELLAGIQGLSSGSGSRG